MIVRELEKQERKNALDIIWSVFCMDVAEVYEQEGIDTFREYLKQENIDQLCDSGELLMFGVFEQEELDTANTDSDLMISIIESLAQVENESRSENIKWGIKQRAASGTSKLYDRKCYGYKHDKDGKLIIDVQKAENVKLIFDFILEVKAL